MGVNSLPKTVTRQCRGGDLNPGSLAPESSTLTARLPSHHLPLSLKISSLPEEILTPHLILYVVPMVHLNLHLKRHLSWCSHFCRAHSCFVIVVDCPSISMSWQSL